MLNPAQNNIQEKIKNIISMLDGYRSEDEVKLQSDLKKLKHKFKNSDFTNLDLIDNYLQEYQKEVLPQINKMIQEQTKQLDSSIFSKFQEIIAKFVNDSFNKAILNEIKNYIDDSPKKINHFFLPKGILMYVVKLHLEFEKLQKKINQRQKEIDDNSAIPTLKNFIMPNNNDLRDHIDISQDLMNELVDFANTDLKNLEKENSELKSDLQIIKELNEETERENNLNDQLKHQIYEITKLKMEHLKMKNEVFPEREKRLKEMIAIFSQQFGIVNPAEKYNQLIKIINNTQIDPENINEKIRSIFKINQ
ncbi:hypothetical protein TRFO_20405 [Tritrichomonas foetus]|uniref:Uncharacterized protein n=1 Tax=Tritrichomonas foetus TaxID=1144522 RepID=A0A1J4KG15_9EUKA|nr:hypothetical protein TRFO_20405 [Tritrichomonas foetus]|eukprot:OHT10359.1 hypothetical protein TRFO_20405 [Tritrichomonas foetus]